MYLEVLILTLSTNPLSLAESKNSLRSSILISTVLWTDSDLVSVLFSRFAIFCNWIIYLSFPWIGSSSFFSIIGSWKVLMNSWHLPENKIYDDINNWTYFCHPRSQGRTHLFVSEVSFGVLALKIKIN